LSPKLIYSLVLQQNRYEHEVVSIKFRDWGVEYDSVETGTPITFTLGSAKNIKQFYGYVHHINVNRSPGTNMTEVVAVSASMIMKNESQHVYKGMSADGIIQQIANKNNFVAFTVPHPRIYPQVAQAGHTDWELMVRLAKQCGYSLRTENTEIYFQPMLYEYTTRRSEAPVYVMNGPASPQGSTIYSFDPVISETLDYDGDKKGAVAVGGVDKNSTQAMSITQQIRAKNTKSSFKPEFFDRFATNVVASDPATAKYEAEAAENRNMFPYRGTAEVIGNASLRPDLPVYLSGIGSQYSGYWTILGTEHKVVEDTRNIQKYTTILYLGTDSLGSAVQWTDGQTVYAPTSGSVRSIVPGVRQTASLPITKLKVTSPNIGQQSFSSFGVATNRKKSNASSPVWVTGTLSLDPITQQVTSSTTTQTNRQLNKVSRSIV
jgi:phage protein D